MSGPSCTGPRGPLQLGSSSHSGREAVRVGAQEGSSALSTEGGGRGVEPLYLQSSAEIVRFI